tara:strand:- start:207 stop:3386 length:3180 start_codon:yes stop_codon:yes gene_type:complete
MTENILTILHLSDFHFSKKRKREQKIIIDALSRDLTSLCYGYLQPDLVIFTGDLVNSAGEDDASEAYDFFLSRVSEATKVSEERIFITPGNHDVIRSEVIKLSDDHEFIRKNSEDMTIINNNFENCFFTKFSTQKFSDFHYLRNYLSESYIFFENDFCTLYRISEINMDLVIFNTAVTSTGGIKYFGTDLKKLIIPEYAIQDCLDKCKPDAYRIICTHHPLSWMSEVTEKILRSAIQKHAHLHLYGHMHEPYSANITSYEGNVFTNQSGALFSGRNRYIGYSITSISPDRNHYQNMIRTYFNERGEFDNGLDVKSDGVFYSSQESRVFWRETSAPINPSDFSDYLSGKCFDVLISDTESNSCIGDRKAHSIFVSPPMKRTSISENKDEYNGSLSEKDISFLDVIENDSNIIFHSPPEFGKTTFLKELERRICSDSKKLKFSRLPVYIEFSEIRTNVERMKQIIRSNKKFDDSDFNANSLSRQGRLCILIDDVEFSDVKKMSIIRQYISDFPRNRYIFTSRKDNIISYGTSIDPEMPISFETVEICAFRRRDMRQLVEKWQAFPNVDIILDRIQEEISQIHLPFTPANGSIFMVIFEENHTFQPINRSVLLEQFIDITLRKSGADQSQRETFDYHNKTTLLAYIAGSMARKNKYILDHEEMLDLMNEHIQRIEVNANTGDLFTEFLISKIFVLRQEQQVSFRYRCILEYFISLHMKKDLSFKEWIFDESRYLSYVNEILYYAGIVRDDEYLMTLMSERFRVIVESLEDTEASEAAKKIETLVLPGKSENSDSIKSLSEQLGENPLSERERDEILDADLPKDAEDRQEVFRPQFERDDHKFFLCLILLSGLVKNLEEIPGEEKRYQLENVWSGWLIVMMQALLIVPDLAHKRRIRVNGVMYEINAPLGISVEELTRQISLGVPIGVTQLISEALGTEKLERQLIEYKRQDVPEHLVFKFFRSSLVADLRLSQTANVINDALRSFEGSRYLSEVMLRKVALLRRLGKISEDAHKKMAGTIAESLARLGGHRGKELANKKRSILAKINKDGIILRMKRQQGSD